MANSIKKAERRTRRWFARHLGRLVPRARNVPLGDVRDVQHVLLVRTNFRMGNALMATPLIEALRSRFPGATVDVLCSVATGPVFRSLGVGEVHTVSRGMLLRPWAAWKLLWRLRARRYEVSTEAGFDSLTDGLCCLVSGARWRVGLQGDQSWPFNVRLEREAVVHAYDRATRFGRCLGVPCLDRPLHFTSHGDRAIAAQLFRDPGWSRDQPVLLLCICGHRDKRWPITRWVALGKALVERGNHVVVCMGPEEVHLTATLEEQLPDRVALVPPRPLGVFAAMLERSDLVVAPDSGPMHLAVAVDVPVLAVLQRKRSIKYAPRGPLDQVRVQPTVAEVVAAADRHRARSMAGTVARALRSGHLAL